MSKFIEKHKKLYRKLDPCYCLAIGETVHFTSEGLHHILYYRRRPRSHAEKHYRAGLIPFLPNVVKNAKRATKTISTKNNKTITIWAVKNFEKVSGEHQLVKVILVKEGAGKVKFLSVMSKKYKLKKPS